MQAGFLRDLPCAVQRFRRSSRLVAQFEIGMKRGEVQRHVGTQVHQNPFGQLARLRRIVIQAWNHQVGDLEPNIRLILQPLQRLEYRLEMSQCDLAVEVFSKTFQVDVCSVDVVINVVKRFAGDVAIGNHHPLQPKLFRRLANIDDILAPDRRLVVGKRQRIAAIL